MDQLNRSLIHNMLVTLDFKTNEVNQITDRFKGGNISTTPWIGDWIMTVCWILCIVTEQM